MVIRIPTHGSLTKTGKVRQLHQHLITEKGKKPNPKIRNRRNYKKRIILGNIKEIPKFIIK